ncbi:MAG: GMC family oxidoreductase [Proteobacteria bacterium]|nr:GMC family oxidoreductase [Pseudomonadota bacterium]
MARNLPETDVVIIGLGWTGAIAGMQMVNAGKRVVAIERGPWRDTASDFSPAVQADELRFAVQRDLFLQPRQEALTFRNKPNETALPLRDYVSFLPGVGVGGAGVHWNGQTWRFLPTDFKARSHLEQRYGKAFLPPDMTLQDWGVSYDELEPHYDAFEKLCGTSGKAGNLKGKIQEGGNPFEGWRSSEYPTPALNQAYGPTLFADAARKLGYKPFPQPASNLSKAYVNPLGVQMGQCSYCGYCERFGCGNYSKASPQACVLPVLVRNPNFEARTRCEVLKINVDSAGKKATGVTYVDEFGEELFQPASIVLLCAFSFFNVRMLLLSGIGKPYDFASGTGVVGRNYAYQTTSSVQVFFKNKIINPFIASGSHGMMIDDFNGDNIDHGPLGYVGGGYMGAGQTNGRPIQTSPTPAGAPAWGAGWKKAVRDYYNASFGLSVHGSSYSYKDCFLDLDPNYTDRHGRPLLRMTFDFHDNELTMAAHTTKKLGEIARAMDGAEIVEEHPRKGPYSTQAYQTTHNTGGTVMGTDPATSVVNRYCQSWDVSNLFIPGGASVFPQNHGYNPTNTVGALAYWTSAAIVEKYLKNPGPLM